MNEPRLRLSTDQLEPTHFVQKQQGVECDENRRNPTRGTLDDRQFDIKAVSDVELHRKESIGLLCHAPTMHLPVESSKDRSKGASDGIFCVNMLQHHSGLSV
jgi:hypothetical protein